MIIRRICHEQDIYSYFLFSENEAAHVKVVRNDECWQVDRFLDLKRDETFCFPETFDKYRTLRATRNAVTELVEEYFEKVG